jgi:hypothetical protein
MLKPDSLRAAIAAAVPELKTSPEALRIWIDKGTIRSRLTPAFNFEYRYRLNCFLKDYAGHPDTLMAPIIAWLRANQPDLLQNHDRADNAVSFEVDIVDRSLCDVLFQLELSETVRSVARDGGGFDLVHDEEPVYDPMAGDVPRDTQLIELYVDGVRVNIAQPDHG